jgi:hypothetical protein
MLYNWEEVKKMNKKKFLKEASVLLIATVMMLSTLVVTANTNDLKIPQDSLASTTVTNQANPFSINTGMQTTKDVLFHQQLVGPDGDWAFINCDSTLGYAGIENFEISADAPIEKVSLFGLPLYHDGAGWVAFPPEDVVLDVVFFDDNYNSYPTVPSDIITTFTGIDTFESIDFVDEYVGFSAYKWTFELPENVVVTGQDGWMQIEASSGFMWGNSLDGDLTSYQVGVTPPWLVDDRAMTLYGEGGSPLIPDLDCTGSLSWADVTPGDTVSATFTVENVGDPESLLNWEIDSFPAWGNWTFAPENGVGLTPEDGAVIVTVEVVAPMDQETEFTGEVKIINSDNASEFCIIDVALATPVSLLSQAKPFSFAKTQAGAFLPLMALTWLHYDDGTNVNSIGLTDGGYFEWGIRLTPDELSNYDGKELTTVKFHHGWVDSPAGTDNGNIYVYEAGTPTSPGAQIPSATTPWEHTGSDWLEVTLLNPVVVDGTADLWITIDVDHAAGEYPAGVGPGPMVAGKGGWISLDGVAWDQLGDFGLDYNWNLWAGIDDGGSPPLVPDLTCEGSLSWADVEPGSTVNGSFVVENIGNATSLLNWEVQTYPTWGNWTITPASGVGLTPEDGPLTINVEVIAPDDPETDFTGEIIIVNSDDADDTCTVDVVLATPVSYQSPFMVFIQRLVQRFPVLGFIINLL